MVSEQDLQEQGESEDIETTSSSSGTDSSSPSSNSSSTSISSKEEIQETVIMMGKKKRWSSGMRLALEEKSKLGLIDGSCIAPTELEEFDKWRKVDCLVRSWILNTVTDEIKGNYSSTTTALDLWYDIQERYQENNGPQAFQIQKGISNLRQGPLTLEKYFSKIKKLWDELLVLEPLPFCDSEPRSTCCCKMTKLVIQQDTSNKLTQFLMGLNEYYDNIRQQILLMDPKPSINKVYAMLLSIERQREVQSLMIDQNENFSMLLKDNIEQQRGQKTGKFNRGKGGRQSTGRGNNKGSSFRDMYCTYCRTEGHNQDGCFKLNGYPDWWKGNRDQKIKKCG
ncbi:uncharacterized protein LOC124946312 [Impatiens glandulifera]|uniref:uncharacterized protein LOC124946312 n=1 Tax=Impatiens glandulifera TaxID=253017 RepID=UPI001FB0C88A|nr:uncharacterized protein LOC124946312 [Impatiens glandulifera]